MKNTQKTITKYFISSALLILAFGPTFAFGMFSDQPVYSDQTETTENREKTNDVGNAQTTDRSTNENTGPQRFADQGVQEGPDRNEDSSSGYIK